LTSLDLSANTISSVESMTAIGQALLQSPLQRLNLSQNGISSKSLLALAEGLKQNVHLTDLNLFSNIIGKDGLNDFIAILLQSKLRTINLNQNDLGTTGNIETALLHALQGTQVLRLLAFRHELDSVSK
jgi:Ran GTPase-activating protein (RanGAP) involved in mRNA processing and transport